MKRRITLLLVVFMFASLVLTACNNNTTSDPSSTSEPTTTQTPDSGKKDVLKIGYVQWACANANSHMVEALLEDKFNVDVELVALDAGVLWQAVSTSDVDFMVTAWLPTTHSSYYKEFEGKFVDLGPLYEGAKTGLVVPSYVTIDSIAELNDHADKFDSRIVGIDPGAGIMAATTQAIKDYTLDYELVSSSDGGMMAELSRSYGDKEWIAITGWAPHWMFDAYDLKFLEDPNNAYGTSETINPITRLGFADDYPEINEFLDNYSLTVAEFGGLINVMEEYDDDNEAAKAWIADNADLVNSWFK